MVNTDHELKDAPVILLLAVTACLSSAIFFQPKIGGGGEFEGGAGFSHC